MSGDCGQQCANGPSGRIVPLEQAVGLILAHDVTEIVPGKAKGPAFRKGHVVRAQDLERLAAMGKRNLYVLEIGPEQMHEDEAAELMAQALAGPGVCLGGPPREGKITLLADRDGLFMVDVARLIDFNLVDEVMCATIHRHTPVKKGQPVAGTRAIPLTPLRQNIARAVAVAQGGLIEVAPIKPARTGIVVTGNEVASGLIQDGFAPVVRKKLAELGASVLGVKIAPDDRAAVAGAIRSLLADGAELIITTAGMSVDPDDVTRHAIVDAGGLDLVYGAPMLPGAMFLVGKLAGPQGLVPVLGVPACALYHPTTILDVILPRVLAGQSPDRADMAALAHGGFCRDCPGGCRFPFCGFGRGA